MCTVYFLFYLSGTDHVIYVKKKRFFQEKKNIRSERGVGMRKMSVYISVLVEKKTKIYSKTI